MAQNQGEQSNEIRKTSKRGFAAMNPEQQRLIASKGGTAAHKQGKAHEWSSKEAAEAGRKGGKASHTSRGSELPTAQKDEQPVTEGVTHNEIPNPQTFVSPEQQ